MPIFSHLIGCENLNVYVLPVSDRKASLQVNGIRTWSFRREVVMIRNRVLPSPLERWPCHHLALGKPTPMTHAPEIWPRPQQERWPPTFGKAGPVHHYGRADSTLYLRGMVPVTWSDQLCYHPDTHPRLLVDTPQYLPCLWSAVACEGTGAAKSQSHNLHNLPRQLQEIWEDFWCGAHVANVPEARALNLTNITWFASKAGQKGLLNDTQQLPVPPRQMKRG